MTDNFLSIYNAIKQVIEGLGFIAPVYQKYLVFIPLFIAGFVLSLIIVPLIGQFAIKYKIVDEPQTNRRIKLNKFDDPNRHIHSSATPLLGALSVILPFLLIYFWVFKPDNISVALFLGISILTIAGVIDDIFNLPAPIQLTFQLLAALIIAFSTANITFINSPFGGIINLNWWHTDISVGGLLWSIVFPGDLLIVPWIILCINAVKWVGGSDGIMEGNIIIAYILMAVLGIRDNNILIIITSIYLAGAISGFLYYNFPPAKIYSGSVGKTVFGFIIASLAIIQGAKLASTILILALPILDAIFVLIKRYKEYKPKNLLDLMRINDNSHIHHQLLKLDMSPKQVFLAETSVALITGSIAVLTTGAFKLFAILAISTIIVTTIFLIHRKTKNKPSKVIKKGKEESPESKYSY